MKTDSADRDTYGVMLATARLANSAARLHKHLDGAYMLPEQEFLQVMADSGPLFDAIDRDRAELTRAVQALLAAQ